MRQNWTAKRIVAALAVVAAIAGLPGMGEVQATSLPAQIDPLRLYGPELRFDVLRNGERVGRHVVAFRGTADGIQVESRSDIEVKLLFLTAYRFRYQSIEHWRGGTLTSLNAATNDDGELSRVEARREGAALKVRTGTGEWQATPQTWPTTHWNVAQTTAPALLNTLTGNLNRVQVKDAGLETVVLSDGPREARRFVYSGDLAVESWYDAAGRWVKLRFPAEDGSTIEYICQSCGGPLDMPAAETNQADATGADVIGTD